MSLSWISLELISLVKTFHSVIDNQILPTCNSPPTRAASLSRPRRSCTGVSRVVSHALSSGTPLPTEPWGRQLAPLPLLLVRTTQTKSGRHECTRLHAVARSAPYRHGRNVLSPAEHHARAPASHRQTACHAHTSGCLGHFFTQYWFSTVAVTNYHKLGGFKHTRVI